MGQVIFLRTQERLSPILKHKTFGVSFGVFCFCQVFYKRTLQTTLKSNVGGSVALTPLTFLVDGRSSAIPFTNLGRLPTTVCYLPFHPDSPPYWTIQFISQQVQPDKTIKQRTAIVINEQNAFLIAAIYSLIQHNTVHKGFEVHTSPTGNCRDHFIIRRGISFVENIPNYKWMKITSNKRCVGT